MASEKFLNKENSLLLRGICMLMIIIHHAYLDVLSYSFESNSYIPSSLMKFGMWGTGVFFFLSGFGMFISLNKKANEGFDYFFSKMKRLFLPFLYCWLFYILLDSILFHKFPSYNYVFSFLVLSKPYSEAWFFKVIVGLYFLIFIVFHHIKDNKNRLLIIGVVCLAYYFVMHLSNMGGYWYNSIMNFPLGMLCAFYFDRIKKMNIMMILVVSLLSFLLTYRYFDSLSSICFSIFSISTTNYFFFKSKFLSYVGKNSLEFYLFQSPINYVQLLCKVGYNFILYFVVKIIDKLFLCFVYHKIINRVR